MANNILDEAREELQRRLEDIDLRVVQLERERTKLQGAVGALAEYLSGGVDSEDTSEEPNSIHIEKASIQPAWMSARDVIAERGVPMTVPQISEALQTKQIFMAKDALRVAMLRRKDIFINHGNGVYWLHKFLPPASTGDQLERYENDRAEASRDEAMFQ